MDRPYWHVTTSRSWADVAEASAFTSWLLLHGWALVARTEDCASRCRPDGTMEWWLRGPDGDPVIGVAGPDFHRL